MGKFVKKISEKLKSIRFKLGKKSQILLAGILALIMLIIFFNGMKSSSQSTTGSENKQIEAETTTGSASYEKELEERLDRIISSIKGVGEVEVFVMTETSVETIYAGNEEQKSSGEGNNATTTQSVEIVFEKNGSISTPIVSLEIYPEITGVLIVAEGVNDEKLRLLVINAVSVALNIENSKIEVLSGESK